MKIKLSKLVEFANSNGGVDSAEEPLYICFTDGKNKVDRTEVFPAESGVEVALDFNADGVVFGIEFV